MPPKTICKKMSCDYASIATPQERYDSYRLTYQFTDLMIRGQYHDIIHFYGHEVAELLLSEFEQMQKYEQANDLNTALEAMYAFLKIDRKRLTLDE